MEMAKRLRAQYPAARYELDWKTPEQLLVATILAAGSKDAAVNQVTPVLFSRWTELRSLAKAAPNELEAVLNPLGLAAQKTKRLLAIARALVEQHGGEVPRSLEALVALAGVGRKTANVVLTQGFQIPSGIIVDVHVSRLARRMGLTSSDDADEIERQLTALLPRDEWISFGAAGVLHGRYTCLAKQPRCGDCVLSDLCPSKVETATAAASASMSTSRSTSASASASAAWPEEYQLPGLPALETSPTAPPTAVMPDELPADWALLLSAELSSGWYRDLTGRVAADRAKGSVYPPPDRVFEAFRFTPLESLKVVLLGQDPYHGAGQAHGLAFSVPPGVKPPPSLVNIFKELHSDVGVKVTATGCLEGWARQGILLLNTALTVRESEPGSHSALGWEKLTDAVIRHLSARPSHTVFVLWGAHARKKVPLVDRSRHTVVQGAHPSPLSQKLWFGSKPFSQIDAALKAHRQAPIDWSLT